MLPLFFGAWAGLTDSARLAFICFWQTAAARLQIERISFRLYLRGLLPARRSRSPMAIRLMQRTLPVLSSLVHQEAAGAPRTCPARVSVAASAMLSDVAKSNVPMLGYAVPCAVSTTLLTIGGMVIIFLVG